MKPPPPDYADYGDTSEPIYDLPDIFAEEAGSDEGGPFTLLVGIGFGILMGLALGELWSLIGAAS